MRFLRQFSLFALTALSGLALVACDGGGTTVFLTSIAVKAASSSLTVGGAATQLTVTGFYSDGRQSDLTAASTFVSSNTSVLAVSAGGAVTPVAPGTAVVTATNAGSGKTAATEVITVSPAPPPTLTSIAVTAASSSLTVGGATTQLTVTGTYSSGPTQNLTASSTYVPNTAGVVSISAGGVVTAVAAGTTTITATSGGKTATTSTITVTAPPPPTLTSIAATVASSSLTVGGATTQLTVTGTYSSGPTQNLTAGSTFVANTPGIVTISGSGVVTPAAAGTTTITATHTASGLTSTTGTITVSAAAATSYAILDFNDPNLTYKFDTFGTGAVAATTSTGVPPSPPAGGPAFVKFIRHGASPGPADACYSGATMWGETATTGNLESIGRIPLSNTNSVVQAVVYVPVASVKYRLKLEDASNNAHYVEIDVTPPTTGWQTLSFDAKLFATATFDPSFVFNKLTLFPDFTCGAADPPADETLYVGPITFAGASGPSAPALSFPPPLATPSTNAPAPSLATHPAVNVLSLFNSGAIYTDLSPAPNFNPFGDSKSVGPYMIGSQSVWKYGSMNYQGWQFATLDLSTYTHMHVDVWTPDSTKFEVQLVNGPAGQTVGQVNFDGTTTPAITTGTWISLDIPLTSFTTGSPAIGGFTSIYQLLWLDNVGGNGNGTFYIDNVYFWK